MHTYAPWCRGLLRAGYSVVANIDLVTLPYPQPPYASPPFPRRVPGGAIEQVEQIKRKYFNLSAARHPIAMLPGLSFDDREEMRFAFPEKYLAARVIVDGGTIDVHNAHLPAVRAVGDSAPQYVRHDHDPRLQRRSHGVGQRPPSAHREACRRARSGSLEGRSPSPRIALAAPALIPARLAKRACRRTARPRRPPCNGGRDDDRSGLAAMRPPHRGTDRRRNWSLSVDQDRLQTLNA